MPQARRAVWSCDTFPFLSLPVDIRNQIYHLSLDTSYALNLVNTNSCAPLKYSRDRVNYDWRSTPGILLVSRQVHHEAIEILYLKRFILNRGCRPSVLLGAFSKTFLQRIRHVTLNIHLDSDWESRHDTSYHNVGWWLDITTMLSIVWDQRHSLRTLTINVTGAQAYFMGWSDLPMGFESVTYLHLLLQPLQDLRGIPLVAMSEDIPTLGTDLRTMALAILGTFSNLLKLEKDADTQSLRQHLPQLPGWWAHGVDNLKHGGLLSTEFIRWWSLAEEGFRFDKKELVCEVSLWPNFRDLKKAWASSSWRCLPYFPLRTARNVIERGRKKFSEDEWGTRLYFAEYDKKVALKEWAA